MSREYLVARLKEPSTWPGLTLCMTALGIGLKPDQVEAITFLGLFVAGMIGAATPDK